MAVTIYHNPRCGTSRKTVALLEEKGIAPRIVEYLNEPLKAEEIKALLEKLGKGVRDLVRRKEAPSLGLDLDNMTDAQIIAAMAKNPILMERPVVVNGRKAAIGRPPEAVLAIL
jgi:arsenate reductase